MFRSYKFVQLIGVKVYLEWNDKRFFVGLLTKSKSSYKFEYDHEYMKIKGAMDLGPEMPFRKHRYSSQDLFVPFQERIPLRENPAYPDYCHAVNISIDENNPFVLLTTLAQRGPSSFVFEPYFQHTFST